MDTNFKLFLPPLFAFIIISYLRFIPVTEATAEEIKAICDETQLPQACLSCLGNNDNADKPTLAKIGAGCGKSDAQRYADTAFAYFGGAPAGELKDYLGNCTVYGRELPPLFDDVISAIDGGRYGDAQVKVTFRMFSLVNYCVQMSKSVPNLPWPTEVLNLAAAVIYDLSTVSKVIDNI